MCKNLFLSLTFTGDLPYEAHVQTHSRGAPSEPPIATEDRVPQHPHSDLPHLSPPSPLKRPAARFISLASSRSPEALHPGSST